MLFRDASLNAVAILTDEVITTNTWYHIAVVRSNGFVKMYLNGMQTGEEINFPHAIPSTTTSGTKLPLVLGRYSTYFLDGSMQGILVSKKAVYKGCFVPKYELFPSAFTPNEPTCEDIILNIQSNTLDTSDEIIDSSTNAFDLIQNGSALHNIENAFIGDSSLTFDGVGGHVVVPHTNDFVDQFFNIENQDFTIEFWFNTNVIKRSGFLSTHNFHHNIQEHRVDAFDIELKSTGHVMCFFRDASLNAVAILTDEVITTNTWYHIAVVRSNGFVKMYLNGMQTGEEINFPHAIPSTTTSGTKLPLVLGRYSTYFLDGSMQGILVSKKAVYKGCFVPKYELYEKCETPTPTPIETPTEPLQYVDLDGTLGGYVSIDNTLNLSDATTFSWWFNAQQETTNVVFPIIHKERQIYIDLGNNRIRVNLFDTTNQLIQNESDFSTEIAIGRQCNFVAIQNQWYHFVVTYDGGNTHDGINFYINGIKQTSGFHNSGSSDLFDSFNTNSDEIIAVGSRLYYYSIEKYHGFPDGTKVEYNDHKAMLLDDISIFNSELAESDVAILFNNGRPGDIASLNPFCWWKMSQGDIENEIENDGTSNIPAKLEGSAKFYPPTPIPENPNDISIISESVIVAPQNSTKIEISTEDQSLFSLNQNIVFSPNTSKEEYNQIIGFGSLQLRFPLLYTHDTGSQIGTLDRRQIEYTGIPFDISSILMLWFDAADLSSIKETGKSVEIWEDKSGNSYTSYNLIQLNEVNRPETESTTYNVYNVIEFLSTDSLRTNVPFSSTYNFTINMVVDIQTAV